MAQAPDTYYHQRIEELNTLLSSLYKRRNLFGWLRLLSILSGAFLVWFNSSSGAGVIMAIVIIFIALFLFLVNRDLSNRDDIEHQEQLLRINQTELLYLQHKFTQHPDGSNLVEADHPYAEDLDVFGRASLYQYINRTHSEQGNYLLASWMKSPTNSGEILGRQAAAQELTTMPNWMQEFRARAGVTMITINTEQTIRQWLGEKNQFVHKPAWSIARYVVPMLALGLLFTYIIDLITYQQFLSGLAVFGLIAFSITRQVAPLYAKLNRISSQIDTLHNGISYIEQASFSTASLKGLQQQLMHDGIHASRSINQLNKILSRFDYRFNPLVFIPLNIFLLWDLQQVLQLEQWKEKNTREVGHWFETLASFESLTSIATLAFNHPSWTYPTLNTSLPEFTAQDLGHPLIDPSKVVLNSFTTVGEGKINVITGSNMAGKSTFLRSVGVNMVLGSMGAPVFASAMTFTPLRVMSSMRIKDNLEESTSTFYAELKKLKSIIDAVKAKAPVFILLDEILRGTNSHDRHTGSKALIRQLLQDRAVGLIATHDLELATLAQDDAGIHNYHFDVQVKGEELFFDYKLKSGICTSLNASILMRKIGIKI